MQSLAFNLFISLAQNKYKPGLEKVPSDRPGEIHFPNGQVTFQSHLPSRQKPREIFCELNKQSNLGLAQGKQNLTEAACPKGKLEFNFFSSSKIVEKLNKLLIDTFGKSIYFFHWSIVAQPPSRLGPARRIPQQTSEIVVLPSIWLPEKTAKFFFGGNSL